MIRLSSRLLLALAIGALLTYGAYRFLDFLSPHQTNTLEIVTRERIVMTTEGGELGVARIKSYEDFHLSNTKEWMHFNFGTTESEVRVAALFRYVIPLAKQWPIDCDNEVCVVRSPAVQASPPAAIYSEETRKYTRSGWARFDKAQNLQALEKSLTSALNQRASEPRNMAAAQEAGRPAVEGFVRTWVLRNRPGPQPSKVIVLFPGESPEARRKNDAAAL
jgi:hypothetical protein